MNKVAFIIGNSTYPDAPLINPVNDADAINKKLINLGFECIVQTDVSAKTMEEGLNDFGDALSNNEVGLFFFAGHGMQISGKNYLTAIDTNFEKEIDAKYTSLPLNKVIDVMEQEANRTNIIILDACRNNPYERKWRGIDTLGLAPVYTPKGMIIAYATSPGQVALDGEGDNGAYTTAILHHISTQDITIEDLFKRVRNTLSSSTKGKQISWEHTSLMGDFYFNFSILIDDFVTEYSKSALADSKYISPEGSNVRDIIDSLKSNDWHIQNPAITQFKEINLDQCDKNDLFIVGRNIYQAACGGAFSAIDYLQNISTELKRINRAASLHILNGLLCEIYFDSHGQKRAIGKTDRFDAIFSIEEDGEFSPSFGFIVQVLTPYIKELFYIPGTLKEINIDVTTKLIEDNKPAVFEVFYEGENVLYNENGDSYFEPLEDDWLTYYSIQEFSDILAASLMIPKHRLKVNYIENHKDDTRLLAPRRPRIQRYSK